MSDGWLINYRNRTSKPVSGRVKMNQDSWCCGGLKDKRVGCIRDLRIQDVGLNYKEGRSVENFESIRLPSHFACLQNLKKTGVKLLHLLNHINSDLGNTKHTWVAVMNHRNWEKGYIMNYEILIPSFPCLIPRMLSAGWFPQVRGWKIAL